MAWVVVLPPHETGACRQGVPMQEVGGSSLNFFVQEITISQSNPLRQAVSTDGS